MNSIFFCRLPLCLLGLIASLAIAVPYANAGLIYIEFAGVVTNSFDNTPANGDQIFDLNVTEGDAMTGGFYIDNSVSAYGTASGPVGGSAAGYFQSPPIDFTISLNGASFRSEGDYAIGIANDYQDTTTFPAFDSIQVSDGRADTFNSNAGTTISMNGVSKTAFMSFSLTNNNATALNSIELPSTIDLSSFENRSVRIIGEETVQGSTQFYSAEFSIQSLKVTAVPEPTSLSLAGLVGLCGAFVRVRSRSIGR